MAASPGTPAPREPEFEDLADLPRTRSGRPVRVLDEVDSTNSEALRLLGFSHLVDGEILIARRQVAGRGRRGRSWQEVPGCSLALTLCLSPPVGFPLATCTMLGAVAVAEVLEHFGLTGTRIKWPNDVLVEDRKICGILPEARTQGDTLLGAVVGIGLNVGQENSDFPPELRETATSLRRCGVVRTVPVVAVHLINALDSWLDVLADGEPEILAKAFGARLGLLGRAVEITTGSGIRYGVLAQIAPDGSLKLDAGPGEPSQKVPGGHVQAIQPRPPASLSDNQ